MPKQKEIDQLVQAFEEMYKYYKGWVFAYEYPGFFAYHQMGGDLSVMFTPDWNEEGKVAIQIQDLHGNISDLQDVPYVAPEGNGRLYEQAQAWEMFRIVRPFLENLGTW